MEDRGRQQFTFQVDNKPYHTDQSSLTGAEIKGLAGVQADYQLFLEGDGNDPDTPVSDAQTVSLSEGIKKFFAVPPATFGS